MSRGRRTILVAVALSAVLGAVALFLDGREPEMSWTTDSPEALAELEQAIEDMERFYRPEAIAHLDRAVELDPDFAAARVMRLFFEHRGSPARAPKIEELRRVATEDLNPRELFLVHYTLARADDDRTAATGVLDGFLAEYPKDAWGIMTRCDEAWEEEQLEAASECLGRLLELYPNWGVALSRLGLLAMARGELERAEELFGTYRYIAPDQAAPFDSLGQLYTLTGRYEDAEALLRESIAVKQDFCEARRHLVRVYVLAGRLEDAWRALRATEEEPGCQGLSEWGYFCVTRGWLHYLGGELERAASAIDEACLERRGGLDQAAHRIAVARGDLEQARQLEARFEVEMEAYGARGIGRLLRNFLASVHLHIRGIGLMAEGRLEEACSALGESDELALFWGIERGSFKLFNQRELATCLERSGQPERAGEVRERIAAVNPRFLDEYSVPPVPPAPTPSAGAADIR